MWRLTVSFPVISDTPSEISLTSDFDKYNDARSVAGIMSSVFGCTYHIIPVVRAPRKKGKK